jgi:hypothetical protein
VGQGFDSPSRLDAKPLLLIESLIGDLEMRFFAKEWLTSTVLLCLTGAFFPGFGADLEEGFVSMFNGQDLAGWEGMPGWWSVEDGAITSQSTPEKPCPRAHYLMWRGGEPGDFEMRLEFRLLGGNSGVQFRSKELPDWDTSGYQADIEEGGQWTGCLFEHTRLGLGLRGQKVLIDEDGTKHVTFIGDPLKLLEVFRKDDWNSYRIIAQGSEITLMINGRVMCEVTDNQSDIAAKSGVIALQMHPGPPMKIQFRNLRIKALDGSHPPEEGSHPK